MCIHTHTHLLCHTTSVSSKTNSFLGLCKFRFFPKKTGEMIAGLCTSSSTWPFLTSLGGLFILFLDDIFFTPNPVDGVSPNIFLGMLEGRGDPVFNTVAYDFFDGEFRDKSIFSSSSGIGIINGVNLDEN